MWIKEFDRNEALEYPQVMAETFGGEATESSLELELARELPASHPLSGCSFQVLAKNDNDPNEFIFETSHPEHPVVRVHLTWQMESDPVFPYFEDFLGGI
ncbi:hypothetical protein KCM76_23855 [Zooshikella marina]|uniref:hypothetical protein n=1 Tax=Zooshikella ganghwensis TaxID=202772 RepID=UPI001BAE74C1|nr:hypothetical protein [Zooshikella ganghwensis]MBU2709052.1 hypothetical protein [Zooshikella ganghwensis]